ncbi:MerR family transcriptional regulator [Streptomyces sp. XM4193]|uniref:MerR family transcriptional regulator n=1 Tax=Streptomyces sp. XM4193 TaxID=2929782 RepID=UPI001FF8476C|nr:MerR family transcriptional regulator [Streptomyces sp. XM4193]MCK1795318.1 MerR family transcriptional regulator [Streptomyces sp. XM4193]
MLSIGDFAKYGGVSVRMLRHYDAVGLLRPARVDEFTGYRSYTAGQLARLNRVIALRELGFGLREIAEMLDEEVAAVELRAMLRLRRAQLAAAVAADTDRLLRVEARLRTIESEGVMPVDDVVVKRIPAQRVAQLSAEAEELLPQYIGPVVGPLFRQLCGELERAGLRPAGPGVARYARAGEGESGPVRVHVAMPVTGGARGAYGSDGAYGFEVVELPAMESAATVVHRGSMDEVLPTLQRLGHWIEANGYRSLGIAREVTLAAEGGTENWVTELQEPVRRADEG